MTVVALAMSLMLSPTMPAVATADASPARTRVDLGGSSTLVWRHGCRYKVSHYLQIFGTHGEEGTGFEDSATVDCRRHTRFWNVIVEVVVFRRHRRDRVIARESTGPFFKNYHSVYEEVMCTPHWEQHGVKLYARARFKRRGHAPLTVKTIPIKRGCMMPDEDFDWPPLE